MARQRDLLGVQAEFERIFDNLDKDPPSAVTASCALLESLFKIYIDEQALALPSDQSIKSLWNVVRKDLKFDPAVVRVHSFPAMTHDSARRVSKPGSLSPRRKRRRSPTSGSFKERPVCVNRPYSNERFIYDDCKTILMLVCLMSVALEPKEAKVT